MLQGPHRLLGPAWILSHLAVLALLATMISLGLWQLRRLDERRDHNNRVEVQAQRDPVPIVDAVEAPHSSGDRWYRPVVAAGTFDPVREIQVANRSQDGIPGIEVVTLMALADPPGTGVAVNRGFIPLAVRAKSDPSAWAPPTGPVKVAGLAMASRSGGRTSGDQIDRIDLDLLAGRWGLRLLPAYVQASPDGTDDWPLPLPAPDLREGPHLSYAVQWFIFTIIGLVGYPLVLARVARDGRLVA